MTTPIDDFTQEEHDQFRYLIGSMLFQSPVACLFARHVKPLNTLSDYLDVRPDDPKVLKAAKQFLVEFAHLTTRSESTMELAVRWHGPNPRAKVAAELAASMPGLDRAVEP